MQGWKDSGVEYGERGLTERTERRKEAKTVQRETELGNRWRLGFFGWERDLTLWTFCPPSSWIS